MTSNLETTKAVRPVAPYIGGKRRLAKRLCAMIDAIDCTTYAEPFVGMGGIFLRRTRRPKSEVINGINTEIATLFRILQRHYVAFLDMLRFQLTTRRGFERLVKTDPTTLTDLERAARFLYLQRTAFGGKVSGANFGVAVGYPARFDVTKLAPMLEDLHERLAGVVIECLPYAAFIARYDQPETLFYPDPPYWGSENDYGRGVFARADFEQLAMQLAGIRGRFILSINDRPETRDAFAAFRLSEIATTYSIKPGGSTAAAELVVQNF